MTFGNIYDHGMVRVGAVTVPVHLADPHANAQEILGAAREAHSQGLAVAVYPELSLTGYSILDLVQNRQLQRSTIAALGEVVAGSADLAPILVVGAPLVVDGKLFNCAVAVHRGRILGITPKSHLPNYHEFHERRYYSTLNEGEVWWLQWDEVNGAQRGDLAGGPAAAGGHVFPFGEFQVRAIDMPEFSLAMEVCEDVWVPSPPSSRAALAGATIIANPSASPETAGRIDVRKAILKAHSLTSIVAYVYAASGFGESSTDLGWAGDAFVYEAGRKLASHQQFVPKVHLTCADLDLAALAALRRQETTFQENATRVVGQHQPAVVHATLGVEGGADRQDLGLRRGVAPLPWLTSDAGADTIGKALESRKADFAETALNIQVSALVRRMVSIGNPRLIIGVSGGLDSTLALLVAVGAMDALDRPRTDILAYTMPGFGTTDATRSNAEAMSGALGVSFDTVDIRPAAQAMLEAMNHPAAKGEPQYDVTYENVQAGLRTDYLFRFAGDRGGIVVGTGDLSELALGWCTFGVGDQMSHYGVNTGVPKTMVQFLLEHVAQSQKTSPGLAAVLREVLDGEISPELVPSTEGAPVQSTQAAIGPYELQDFTLYHVLTAGADPAKIAFLAQAAWGHKYTDEEILKWLRVFHWRFFASQYKRSTLPDGPKVMSGGSLSPRGLWRMPTDAQSNAWLGAIEELEARLEATKTDPERAG